MDNHTVVQLQSIAKDRGTRGYYKLRKAELIHALEAARLVEQKSDIFDEQIPNDPTPYFTTNTLETIKFRCKKQAKDKKILY